MYGAMKQNVKTGVFKASNVTFDPETCQAFSYNWWQFVALINGKLVFNDYGYSNTTRRHQSKVREVLRRLGIEIDVVVNSHSGLQKSEWKEQSINHYTVEIEAIQEKLTSPRRKKALDAERHLALSKLLTEKAELEIFINTIQE